MKRILLCLFFLLAVSLLQAQTLPPIQPQWEYKIIQFGEANWIGETDAKGEYLSMLQTQGKNGWELVTIFASKIGSQGNVKAWDAVFKRPLK